MFNEKTYVQSVQSKALVCHTAYLKVQINCINDNLTLKLFPNN